MSGAVELQLKPVGLRVQAPPSLPLLLASGPPEPEIDASALEAVPEAPDPDPEALAPETDASVPFALVPDALIPALPLAAGPFDEPPDPHAVSAAKMVARSEQIRMGSVSVARVRFVGAEVRHAVSTVEQWQRRAHCFHRTPASQGDRAQRMPTPLAR